MSVIGEFTVPAEAFALGNALEAQPDVTVTAERVATHSTMEVMPFLWATGVEVESFEAELLADATVEAVTVAERTDGNALFKVEWHDDFEDLIDEMVDQHASVVEARGTGDRWRLKLRFVEEAQVGAFQRYFEGRDRTFDVQRLYHPAAPRQREYNLTPEQHDALVTALREGYFDVPREASTEDLADHLGVSANAVSQRLRRASANLVGSALTIEDDE